MIAALKLGQRVRVWPRPGARVPEHPSLPGRFLPPGGAEVEWSTWWARRVGDGSALLFDPTGAGTVEHRSAAAPRSATSPHVPPQAPPPATASPAARAPSSPPAA